MYVHAIDAVAQYASISYEKGLGGKLLDEETQDIGRSGEIEALDRLTMCLVNLARSAEAANHVDRYFATYQRDLRLGTTRRIHKRIEKALTRNVKGTMLVQAAKQCFALARQKSTGQ